MFKYFKETKQELKHVNWPNQRQTFTYTALVIVISLVVAYYLGLLDMLFIGLLSKFIG
ncbi:MAG: preprotein translocase subunit SecE [Flavobacteriaceae bacterium]|jgi:preprotein translocase subunit SecE